MSKRLKHITFFLALLFAFHFSLLYIFKKVETKNEIVANFQQYEINPKFQKFLFLGTSHTKRAIDTSIIQSSYSMAFYGQNNINAYYLLKHLLENYSDSFEYICFPNDFGYYSKRFSVNLDKMFFYKRFFDFHEYGTLSGSRYKSIKESYYHKYLPYTSLRHMLKSKKKRKEKERMDFSLLTKQKQALSAYNYIKQEHGIKQVLDIYSPLAITYLKMTLQLIKKHNKKAIFIKYPHTAALQIEIEKLGNYIPESDTLIKKAGFEMLDLSQAFLKHNEYFFDSHHLNKAGGIQTSLLIQDKLADY